MRRTFSAAIATAALLALSAAPASAEQALKFGPGPPMFSGDFDGNGALVFHCKALDGGPGATPFLRDGTIRGNCPGAE